MILFTFLHFQKSPWHNSCTVGYTVIFPYVLTIYLNGWIKLYFAYMLHLLNAFISHGASRLFPNLGYFKQCCNKHKYECLYHILEHIPLYIFWGLVLLDCMVVLFLHFWGTSILYSIAVALIYVPINSVEVLLFPQILANICCCLLLMTAILTGMR
jgi:hypothetical protein